MKLLEKIKKTMCMSKTSAVLGFRVTLRYSFLILQPTLISSTGKLPKKLTPLTMIQVWPKPEEGYMLQISWWPETKDCKEVPSSLAQPSTFHRWWHRGDVEALRKYQKQSIRWTTMITWWAWLHKACWWLASLEQHLRLQKTSSIACSPS